MILTICNPVKKLKGTVCYGKINDNYELHPYCDQCSRYYKNCCQRCGSTRSYITLDNDRLCKNCMNEEVIEKGYIRNTDVVLEFLKEHEEEFCQFVVDWYTKE